MAHFIDGFVFPISRDRINEYKRVAEAVAGIYTSTLSRPTFRCWIAYQTMFEAA